MKPWAIAMFGAIALVVAWRLWATTAKKETPPSAASESAEPARALPPDNAATAPPTVVATTTALATTVAVPALPALAAPTAMATDPVAAGDAGKPATPYVMGNGPGVDPHSMEARNNFQMAALERRIEALDAAINAARKKGDQAEALRLVEQSEAAKKRLAIIRAGTQ